jgi:hypothetical protein
VGLLFKRQGGRPGECLGLWDMDGRSYKSLLSTCIYAVRGHDHSRSPSVVFTTVILALNMGKELAGKPYPISLTKIPSRRT